MHHFRLSVYDASLIHPTLTKASTPVPAKASTPRMEYIPLGVEALAGTLRSLKPPAKASAPRPAKASLPLS